MAELNIAIATGRRKNAIARVYLRAGKGDIVCNGHGCKDYFKRASLEMLIKQPLEYAQVSGKFDIVARINGGGLAGQAGALRHGIARALVQLDGRNRSVLKKNGCLTRDPRMVERKKPGRPGARKRFQFSKR